MSEQTLTVYDVVTKLVGPIRPVGKTEVDDVRFQNLEAMVDLVNKLIVDIDRLVPLKNKDEHSLARAGLFANAFFDSLGIVE